MKPYAEVIGDPIAHSKSPAIHSFWLAKLGVDADYRRWHVSADELADYLATRCQDPLWRGCNVTLPHKIATLDHIGDPGGLRETIGAANTVFRNADGNWAVTNTDAAGFFTPIADLPLVDAHAIVIGTGGAAHAILFALARVGIGRVTLLARNPLKGAALLSRFRLKGTVGAMTMALPAAHLLVNATRLGMIGEEPLVVDLAPLPTDAVVYDIVYTPLMTPLLAQAEGRGLTIVDGLEMLVGQAAVAFELFFGMAPPREHDAELRALLTR
ncbi:MAG: shikimate dehydrogenase family protein [Sphingomonadaceae bacterium]